VPEPTAVPSSDQLLIAQDLEVSYGVTQVLWGISFTVAKGKVTCIIGSNGAGKTTALNTIAGVLPVKKGKILLNGADITVLPTRSRVKRHLSLVPEGRQLWPGMSVEENLLMGCFLPALRSHAHSELAHVYELFPRLKERRHQMAGTLSGGEQQMCAIGRALMALPKLLMLDEPSWGLAPVAVLQILEVIREVRRRGVTVLLVEQDVSQALHVATHIHCLLEGRTTLEGSPEGLTPERIEGAYFGLARPSGPADQAS
jgi:branched-chain amino acid transport system ATP-binding protein